MKHLRWKNIAGSIIVLAAIAAPAGSAGAQSLQVPAPSRRQPVALVNARIHTVSNGTIDHGYVVFRDGIITEIGSGSFDPLRETDIVDVQGYEIYPGLIAASTTIGLTEIGAVRATNDQSEVGRLTPEVHALTAVNPDTAIIPVTRANGVLTALVVPQGGLVSGYASIIRLDGWTTEELGIVSHAGLVVRWPRVRPSPDGNEIESQLDTARENLEAIDRWFRDAAAYQKARGSDPGQALDLRFAALGAVLRREQPLLVYAQTSAQIRSAITWCNRMDLKMVLFGAAEADQCLDVLAAHDIPVVIGGTLRLPARRDSDYDRPFTLPKKLRDAGIMFAIAGGTGGASNERNLPYHAAMAVAYGLPVEAALRSVTLDAATILGLKDSHGSLEVGKVATLIVTTGDPLQITSEVVAAYIDGSSVDLGSKHKSLHEKYRARYKQADRLQGK